MSDERDAKDTDEPLLHLRPVPVTSETDQNKLSPDSGDTSYMATCEKLDQHDEHTSKTDNEFNIESQPNIDLEKQNSDLIDKVEDLKSMDNAGSSTSSIALQDVKSKKDVKFDKKCNNLEKGRTIPTMVIRDQYEVCCISIKKPDQDDGENDNNDDLGRDMVDEGKQPESSSGTITNPSNIMNSSDSDGQDIENSLDMEVKGGPREASTSSVIIENSPDLHENSDTSTVEPETKTAVDTETKRDNLDDEFLFNINNKDAGLMDEPEIPAHAPDNSRHFRRPPRVFKTPDESDLTCEPADEVETVETRWSGSDDRVKSMEVEKTCTKQGPDDQEHLDKEDISCKPDDKTNGPCGTDLATQPPLPAPRAVYPVRPSPLPALSLEAAMTPGMEGPHVLIPHNLPDLTGSAFSPSHPRNIVPSVGSSFTRYTPDITRYTPVSEVMETPDAASSPLVSGQSTATAPTVTGLSSMVNVVPCTFNNLNHAYGESVALPGRVEPELGFAVPAANTCGFDPPNFGPSAEGRPCPLPGQNTGGEICPPSEQITRNGLSTDRLVSQAPGINLQGPQRGPQPMHLGFTAPGNNTGYSTPNLAYPATDLTQDSTYQTSNINPNSTYPAGKVALNQNFSAAEPAYTVPNPPQHSMYSVCNPSQSSGFPAPNPNYTVTDGCNPHHGSSNTSYPGMPPHGTAPTYHTLMPPPGNGPQHPTSQGQSTMIPGPADFNNPWPSATMDNPSPSLDTALNQYTAQNHYTTPDKEPFSNSSFSEPWSNVGFLDMLESSAGQPPLGMMGSGQMPLNQCWEAGNSYPNIPPLQHPSTQSIPEMTWPGGTCPPMPDAPQFSAYTAHAMSQFTPVQTQDMMPNQGTSDAGRLSTRYRRRKCEVTEFYECPVCLKRMIHESSVTHHLMIYHSNNPALKPVKKCLPPGKHMVDYSSEKDSDGDTTDSDDETTDSDDDTGTDDNELDESFDIKLIEKMKLEEDLIETEKQAESVDPLTLSTHSVTQAISFFCSICDDKFENLDTLRQHHEMTHKLYVNGNPDYTPPSLPWFMSPKVILENMDMKKLCEKHSLMLLPHKKVPPKLEMTVLDDELVIMRNVSQRSLVIQERFKCPCCELSFVHNSGLKVHHKEAHGSDLPVLWKVHMTPDNQSEGPHNTFRTRIECQQCHRVFKTVADLRDHYKAKHGEQYPVLVQLLSNQKHGGEGMDKLKAKKQKEQAHSSVTTGTNTQVPYAGKMACNNGVEKNLQLQYMCPRCDQYFEHKSSVALHHKKSHGDLKFNLNQVRDVMRPAKQKFLCSICNKKYLHTFLLRRHYRKVHGKDMSIIEIRKSTDQSLPSKPKLGRPVKSQGTATIVMTTNKAVGNTDGKASTKETETNPLTIITKETYRGVSGSYKCSKCTKSYSTRSSLRHHIVYKHVTIDQTKNYSCPVCKKSFKYSSNIHAHYRKLHDGELVDEPGWETHREQVRRDRTKHSSELLGHLGETKVSNLKINDKPEMDCPSCERTFRKLRRLKKHVATTHGRKLTKRDIKTLKQSLESPSDVTQDMDDITDDVVTNNSTANTDLPTLSGNAPYNESRRGHGPVRTVEYFNCMKCKNVFLRKKSLMTHFQEAHSGSEPIFSIIVKQIEKRHKCTYCNLRYMSQGSLRLHCRLKHKGLPLPPTQGVVVDKPLANESKQPGKMKTNKIGKVHQDKEQSTYQKKNITKENLSTFMAPDKQGNFACTLCENSYRFERKLKMHLFYKHQRSNTVPASDIIGGFVCQKCNRIFSSEGSLRVHYRKQHGIESYATMQRLLPAKPARPKHKYRCNLCERSYTNVTNLSRHCKDAHSMRPQKGWGLLYLKKSATAKKAEEVEKSVGGSITGPATESSEQQPRQEEETITDPLDDISKKSESITGGCKNSMKTKTGVQVKSMTTKEDNKCDPDEEQREQSITNSDTDSTAPEEEMKYIPADLDSAPSRELKSFIAANKITLSCMKCGKNYGVISSLQSHLNSYHHIQIPQLQILKKIILTSGKWLHEQGSSTQESKNDSTKEEQVNDGDVENQLRIDAVETASDTDDDMQEENDDASEEDYIPDTANDTAEFSDMEISLQNTPGHEEIKNVSKELKEGDAKPMERDDSFEDTSNMSYPNCLTCGEVFSDSQALQKHSETCNTGTVAHTARSKSPVTDANLLTCTSCDKAFSSMYFLQVHERLHQGEAPYVCHVCQEGFTKAGDLMKHMSTHEANHTTSALENTTSVAAGAGENPYKCAGCGDEFKQKYKLTRHRLSSCANASRPYQCDMCEKAFYSQVALRQHADDTQCSKRFTTEQALNLHLKSCHNMEEDAKDADGEKTDIPDAGDNAQITNTTLIPKDQVTMSPGSEAGEKRCSVCLLKFEKASQLMKHMNAAHKGKTFDCDLCRRKFVRRDKMIEHRQAHPGGETMRCDACAQDFLNQGELDVHHCIRAEVDTPDEALKSTRITPKCNQCRRTFTSWGSLRRHVEQTHQRSLHTCKVCGNCYSRRDTLRRHALEHQPGNCYRCATCRKSCVNLSGLKMHVTHFHKREFNAQTDILQSGTNLKHNELPSAAKINRELQSACVARKLTRNSGEENTGALNEDDSENSTIGSADPENGSGKVYRILKSGRAARSFECIECLKTYCSEIAVVRHHRFAHTGKTYSCHNCDVVYTRHDSLKVHLRRRSCFTGSQRLIPKSPSKPKEPNTPPLGERKGRRNSTVVFPCNKCDQSFDTTHNLEAHMDASHAFPCSRCGVVYTRAHSLKMHKLRHPECGKDSGRKQKKKKASFVKPAMRTCRRCKRLLSSRFNLLRHLKTCRGPVKSGSRITFKQPRKGHADDERSGEHKCERCGGVYMHLHSLQAHKEKCDPKSSFTCSVCSLPFPSRKSLIGHARVHGKGVVTLGNQTDSPTKASSATNDAAVKNMDKEEGCSMLRKAIPKDDAMTQIEDAKDLTSPLTDLPGGNTCQTCHVAFPARNDLQQHWKEQRACRRFPCDVCGFRFKHLDNLKRHMLSIHADQILKCDKCPYKCNDPHRLLRHKVTVHGHPKGKKCNHCGVLCVGANGVFYHQKKNKCGMKKGEKPISQREKIPRAEKPLSLKPPPVRIAPPPEVDTQPMKATKKLKPYQCGMCDKRFSSGVHLRRHMDSVHAGINYPCSTCDRRFVREDLLISHRKKGCANRPRTCKTCGVLCKTKRSFTEHLLMHKTDSEKRMTSKKKVDKKNMKPSPGNQQSSSKRGNHYSSVEWDGSSPVYTTSAAVTMEDSSPPATRTCMLPPEAEFEDGESGDHPASQEANSTITQPKPPEGKETSQKAPCDVHVPLATGTSQPVSDIVPPVSKPILHAPGTPSALMPPRAALENQPSLSSSKMSQHPDMTSSQIKPQGSMTSYLPHAVINPIARPTPYSFVSSFNRPIPSTAPFPSSSPIVSTGQPPSAIRTPAPRMYSIPGQFIPTPRPQMSVNYSASSSASQASSDQGPMPYTEGHMSRDRNHLNYNPGQMSQYQNQMTQGQGQTPYNQMMQHLSQISQYQGQMSQGQGQAHYSQHQNSPSHGPMMLTNTQVSQSPGQMTYSEGQYSQYQGQVANSSPNAEQILRFCQNQAPTFPISVLESPPALVVNPPVIGPRAGATGFWSDQDEADSSVADNENDDSSAALKDTHKCAVCGHQYESKEKLQRHMVVHTNKNKCKQCARRFHNNAALRRHVDTAHSTIKPYSCGICGKAFARTDSLQKHVLIHNDVKPFVCGICGKGFREAREMRRHRKLKHNKVTKTK